MALAFVSSVAAQRSYQVSNAMGDLELVARLREILDLLGQGKGPMAVQARLSGNLRQIVARARELGLKGPTALLAGLDNMKFGGDWKAAVPLDAQTLREAATGLLGRLAQEPGEVADAAARLLAPHAVFAGPGDLPDEREVQLLRDQLGPGSQQMGVVRLFGTVTEALARGGVPVTSFLDESVAVELEERLTASGFDFARGRKVPRTIAWRQDRRQHGIGYSEPIFKDLGLGSVIEAVWIGPWAYEPEHLYLGGGEILPLPGWDGFGNLDGYPAESDPLRPAPGSIRTPYVAGGRPAVFLRVANRGILPTGLREARGAELLKRRGVSSELLAAIFADILPALDGWEAPRDLLSRYLFALLKRPEIDANAAKVGITFFLADFARWNVRQRLEYASRLVGKG